MPSSTISLELLLGNHVSPVSYVAAGVSGLQTCPATRSLSPETRSSLEQQAAGMVCRLSHEAALKQASEVQMQVIRT